MIARLNRDRRGATFVEFALLAPVLLLLLMGLFDLSYRSYVQALLTGALQQAARNGTLEGNATTSAAAAIDEQVIRQVRPVAANLTWTSKRSYYRNYDGVDAEPFDDANRNNKYDPGECFTDMNGNRLWDADPGLDGQGGANDITIYTVEVTYPRLFPLTGLMGLPPDQKISATSALKNQPYDTQSTAAAERICG
ncbi:TadE/TadG family type IV pilus assembly protein [Sphingomonas sp. Leaf10]|uniref:TadE/TadG family type IV pilus assembly protein n=1 Tax=Sphingomonas sp. Leaf10 TaxID=1735676 RepID=UPI0006FF6064|nr:TadE/TadG family type IV pilus assembly protein [Sphingomonas sp. Leaf10]KQM41389.1 hypothetical protein ASE59_03760 [Sphingomonas sp. Leaf10]